jgi:uncharacterized protein
VTDARLAVRVKPRAARSAVEGERGGRLLVSVTEPPVEGRANEALCKLLAKELGIPARRVSIESGKNSRDKLVRIEGMADAEVRSRFSNT